MNKCCGKCEFEVTELVSLVRIKILPRKRFIFKNEDDKIIMRLGPAQEALGVLHEELDLVHFHSFDVTVPFSYLKDKWDLEIIDVFIQAPDGTEEELS